MALKLASFGSTRDKFVSVDKYNMSAIYFYQNLLSYLHNETQN